MAKRTFRLTPAERKRLGQVRLERNLTYESLAVQIGEGGVTRDHPARADEPQGVCPRNDHLPDSGILATGTAGVRLSHAVEAPRPAQADCPDPCGDWRTVAPGVGREATRAGGEGIVSSSVITIVGAVIGSGVAIWLGLGQWGDDGAV